ncbi:MAG: minor capsid protein [Dehalococcoidales bacterium]
MPGTPPSKKLKDLLATHVCTSGWQIEIGAMPAEPHRVIMITDTQSPNEPNPKYLLDFPTCQVMVRGEASGYLATYAEANAVKDLLLGVDSFTTTDGDRLTSITQNGDLGSIGRDENMHPLFSMNFALIVEPQVVGNSNRLAL